VPPDSPASPLPRARTQRSGVWIVGVRIKELLAIDLVVRDRILTIRRDQPIDELLTEIPFDTWMLGRDLPVSRRIG
jgi:hypothetical protein